MKKIMVLFVLGALVVGGAFAATTATNTITVVIPKIQAIALPLTATPVQLDVTAGVAGAPPTGDTDATNYLQYTVVNAGVATSKIQVKLSVDVPAGTSLAVTADTGTLGTGSTKTLTTSDQDLITLIGSGNTGTGGNDGMKLTYVLTVPTPASLVVNAGANVTVTYTILDS